jgi:peptidoglycan/xylan/chitin deacetylase (PgdA/CDA1 family)
MNSPHAVTAHFVNRMTWLAFCILAVTMHAFAADIVYIGKPGNTSYTYRQIEVASSFYGLDVNSSGSISSLLNSISNPKTIAVVINAEMLPALNFQQVFSLMHRRALPVPLLIAGIDESTDPVALKQWSLGAVTACKSVVAQANGQYEVADVSEIARQLSNSTLPLSQRQVLYLALTSVAASQSIINAQINSTKLPVFARTTIMGQSVFFAAAQQPTEIPVTADPYRQQHVFATIAAPMMFLRYAGGDKVWHSPGDYANLTIDDLWLREPYGHVNYEELLQQAQQHNFHVTIAFIPWNFDRSQPALVSLFRSHPDRLSICVHGNNHIHQEFGPLEVHPLEKQVEDIEQSLARMERFKQLTGIPYSAVMVFPHSVSPQSTFAALKHANFLATANSLNVPSDAAAPAGAEFALHAATLHFATFPSLRRYSAENDIPRPQLAIDAFLGNPMLFYVHESFFASGIAAFNRTADTVNQIQPNTQWRDLGDIVQHLYMEKLRDDGNFDIRSYSASIQITNNHHRDADFYVQKEEDFSSPLVVLVDGQPYPYQKTGRSLRLQLPIPSGSTRRIEVKYENGMNLASVDISKHSFKIAAIRFLSDFRDNAVSDTRLGRWFIRSYVDYRTKWNLLAAIIVFIALFLVIGYLYLKKRESTYQAGLRFPSAGYRANETDER